MPRISTQPLKPNPFVTYRDPVTGRWVVDREEPTEDFTPPKPRTPVLQHPEPHLVPMLAETVLTGASR